MSPSPYRHEQIERSLTEEQAKSTDGMSELGRPFRPACLTRPFASEVSVFGREDSLTCPQVTAYISNECNYRFRNRIFVALIGSVRFMVAHLANAVAASRVLGRPELL